MKTHNPSFLAALALITLGSAAYSATTFSDANWIDTRGLPGADRTVYPTVVNSSGKL